MIRIVVTALAMLPGVAMGADCTIENARYKQVGGSWSLSFKPVPQISATNQTVAFIVELPNSALTLEGAVHRPNGYGSATYSIDGPCSDTSVESCSFLAEDAPTIYGGYADGIAMLDDAPGAVAPQQVLLPGLGRGIWYSMYRGGEDFEDADHDDVFTLTGCGMR